MSVSISVTASEWPNGLDDIEEGLRDVIAAGRRYYYRGLSSHNAREAIIHALEREAERLRAENVARRAAEYEKHAELLRARREREGR